jgi:molybdopterin-binding protein
MPRKSQGWITFQSSEEERQILERICQQTQRTKTEVLREMLRSMGQEIPSTTALDENAEQSDFEEGDEDFEKINAKENTKETVTLQPIKISARNILQAKVKKVVKGTVNAEVTLIIAPGVELVSIITRSSADNLKLKKGKSVFAVIKSNNVMIAEA